MGLHWQSQVNDDLSSRSTYDGFAMAFSEVVPKSANYLVMTTLSGELEVWWLEDKSSLIELNRYYKEIWQQENMVYTLLTVNSKNVICDQ